MTGLVLQGPSADSIPYGVQAVVVEVATTYGTWKYRPDLRVLFVSQSVAAHGFGRCVLERPYGSAVMFPHENAFSSVDPEDLSHQWVRVTFYGELGGGASPAFVGRVVGESRKLEGTNSAPNGSQVWECVGPMDLLRRKTVGRSFWDRGSAAQELSGTVPHFNGLDRFNRIAGNRSSSELGGSYVFGGTSDWTRRQALDYLLNYFADESADGGPSWESLGQVELLDNANDVVHMAPSQTVLDAVRVLVSPEIGLDYKVVETDGGFGIFVFSLQSRDVTFEGITLPKNPHRVRFKAGEDYRIRSLRVVTDHSEVYDRIRILGRPAVVCCSLMGSSVGDGSLSAKWASSLETSYLAGTGTSADPPRLHDLARSRDALRGVFSQFGAPTSWGHQGGKAAPVIGTDGDVIDVGADRQLVRRGTLSWLPLREGYDYSTDPPTSTLVASHTAEFLPPQAWVYHPGHARFVGCEAAGMSLSPVDNDWGVFVHAYPQHLLALNNWSGAEGTTKPPVYDYANMVATIAFESDQRLVLEHETGLGDGSVKELVVSDAHLWYLAPGTTYGVDAAGARLASPNVAVVLRNDRDRLAMVMAGAVARYAYPRARLDMEVTGLQAWGDLLGAVVEAVEQGGERSEVYAPITRVEWRPGDPGKAGSLPTTTIKAGYSP